MEIRKISRNQKVNLTKEGVERISISTGFRRNINCEIDLYSISFDSLDKGTIFAKEKLLHEDKEKKKVTVEFGELSQEIKRLIFIDEIYSVQNDSLSKNKMEPPYFRVVDEYGTIEWQFDTANEIGWHHIIIGFELYMSDNEWWLRAVGNSVRHRIFSLMKKEYYIQ